MERWKPGLFVSCKVPRPRGTAKQRSATVRRRRQLQRRWWRAEGRLLARDVLRAGAGGGIFGVSISTEHP